MDETRTESIALNPRLSKVAALEEVAAPSAEKEISKARNIKILLLLMGFIVLVGSVVAAAVYLGWASLPGLSPAKGKETIPAPAAIGPMLKINPLIINLREEGGRHYIKTTIVLEIGRPEWLEEVRSRIPLLTDLMILTLSDKRLKELRDAEAKENLKKELLAKISQELGSPKVVQIYFDEFLYQ